MSEESVSVWRQIIVGTQKSWVLFANNTCVILPQAEGDLSAKATEIIREYGPARAGGPAGDFSTSTLNAYPGWVVTGHHPDVLTYVSPSDAPEADDLRIGLLGRSKRDRDGRDPVVVHVEDRREATQA